MNKRRKGFTLIEILGVIVLLGVLALITVPTVNILIKNSKESAFLETVQTLENAAYRYSNENSLGYFSKTEILEISKLKETGYIKKEEIINPVTEEELKGCIFYRWDDNYKQYEFNYDEDCVLKDLNVTVTNVDGKFNELGWANNDFYVKIETNGTSYNYCVSNKKCSPNALVESASGTAHITTESENIYVCAYAMDGKITSEIVCSDLYKLDKTKPAAGTIELVGEQGENGWYISDVEVVVKDGLDTLSGHKSTVVNKSVIKENIASDKIIVTTQDNADNISTREYIVKLDKTDPTVSITKSVENNKNVLTATTNTITSGVTYKWYKDGNVISGATSSSYTTSEAGTYKVVVTTGSGKQETSNEITIKSYTITYDLNGASGTIASQTKIEDLSINIIGTVPTRSGYKFMGWGLSSSSKAADYTSGSLYATNSNLKLYAIWKRTLTMAFVGNGATISSSSISCDIYNAETSCITKTPSITAANGYSKIGFGTSASSTSSTLSENTNITLTSNNTGSTYYALQSKSITVTYNGNGNTGGTTASSTCTMYNTATTCSITLNNNGYSKTNHTFIGWGTGTTTVSHNAATSYSFGNNTTLYAIWKANYICSTGTLTQNTSYSSATGGWICVANNPTSTDKCTATACNSCNYTTTTYGQDSSCGYATCNVTESGGRWCGSYTYGADYSSYEDVYTDEGEEPCTGNASCKYWNCQYWGISQGKVVYRCYYAKVNGCSSFNNVCVSMSNFNNHREGLDYVADCNVTTNKQHSSCGYASCNYSTTTYGANCSACGSYCSSSTKVYSCPSGWTTYSGSGSGLNCYVPATLAQ